MLPDKKMDSATLAQAVELYGRRGAMDKEPGVLKETEAPSSYR